MRRRPQLAATTRQAWLCAAGEAALAQPPNTGGFAGRLCKLCQMEAHSLANGVSVCQRCGRKMMLATPPDGSVILATLRDVSGPAIWQCLGCDEPDPLKSERVEGWIRSRLRPPM